MTDKEIERLHEAIQRRFPKVMAALGGYYLCPTCGRKSFNPNDLKHRYCAVCGFEDFPNGPA